MVNYADTVTMDHSNAVATPVSHSGCLPPGAGSRAANVVDDKNLVAKRFRTGGDISAIFGRVN
jgi:hypothetical protein